MSTHEKDTFTATYDWAKGWQDLPWSHDEPTMFLAEITRRRGPGKALDIGCGAGTDSLFLAQQGWEVTSLDFMPKALEFTQQRAEAAGVSVHCVEADITEWEPTDQFDLVLDHGLLHNMDPVRYDAYREVVLRSLADEGEFVLLHWHPLFAGQGNGKMGPTRRSRDDVKSFFAPDLQERYFAREEFEDLPGLVGGGMVQAYYWFRKNQAFYQPEVLLEQILATLESAGVDYVRQLDEAGEKPIESVVDMQQLAVILGPGRLGISHVLPEPDEVPDILERLAAVLEMGPVRLRNLLSLFADPDIANICLPDARCDQCSVEFCKRLRMR